MISPFLVWASQRLLTPVSPRGLWKQVSEVWGQSGWLGPSCHPLDGLWGRMHTVGLPWGFWLEAIPQTLSSGRKKELWHTLVYCLGHQGCGSLGSPECTAPGSHLQLGCIQEHKAGLQVGCAYRGAHMCTRGGSEVLCCWDPSTLVGLAAPFLLSLQ